ncbi:protein sorting system archaetidylserine synthase [Salinigranum halophilum]|jgi:CDP-diacylglycerol--serine O-phosphatidyltransferase|uniref:protein sorting system archaetidylserine synthase n=1 Tax=Salinigranum halophilum TaxID=2565931 RepID=UPI00115E3B85|nr:protein sorting system archaetidylserine synthase [Salinigranum halophilum]
MKPRFVGRLGLADAVTVGNAGLGFLAAAAATVDAGLAARLILLAAIADALDGVVARRVGSTPAGPYLDSLADVASFGVAPALLVAVVVREAWASETLRVGVGLAVTAVFVVMAVVRLGLYTAYDTDVKETQGVQTTLAATVIAATVLAGFVDPLVLVVLTLVLAALMVTTVVYPDLHAQDALVMGVVQFVAIVAPGWYGRGFAYALLFLALGYLLLGPVFYWRDGL